MLAHMCGPDILTVVHDLDAWDVPQEKWPVSLQIVASNVFWGRDLAKNLQDIDGIQTALQVGTLIASYSCMVFCTFKSTTALLYLRSSIPLVPAFSK